ncbi:MAG: hypothetical protein R6V19_12190 [Armatimonadota bacterium]
MGDTEQNNRSRSILILSDHKPLNRAHAELLKLHGYRPLTAITYTDAVRLLRDEPPETEIQAIIVASKIHGWHHLEGEQQPPELTANTDTWQIDNIRHVVKLVTGRQETTPILLIAESLIETGCYQLTEEALAETELDYHTYNANRLELLPKRLSELDLEAP